MTGEDFVNIPRFRSEGVIVQAVTRVNRHKENDIIVKTKPSKTLIENKAWIMDEYLAVNSQCLLSSRKDAFVGEGQHK